MNLLYVKIVAGIICVLGAFAYGWHVRNVDYMAFKKEVESIAKVQEEKVKSIRAQQELVTKGIQDEYDAKLSAVRNYYKSTSVWNNASGSKVSGLSAAPSSSDVVTAYNILAGQCAETTLQLTQLQKWLNEQIGIK
jgi:hypothetical protein